ncbi:MAG: hypothetical protein RL264_1009 [Bacteroidota bacterium]|jgi:hypothetical protein
MTKLLLTSLFIFGCNSLIFSQGYQFIGSRSNALGGASVALEDVWAFHHNIAGIANLKKAAAGISYENRFLLKELQSQGVAVAIPMKKGVIGIGMQTFGYNNFRSFRTGVGYALALTEFLSMGVEMNHHFIGINAYYGNYQTVSGEIGLLAKVTEEWKIGFSIVNLTRNKISEFREDRLTTIMRLGTNYRISNSVTFLAEVEKDVEHPVRAKIGFEYLPVENMYIRGGFAVQPVEFTFGAGYAFKGKYRLDLGSAYRQIIGWSPNASFTVQF